MQAEGVLGGNENLYKIEWVGLINQKNNNEKLMIKNVKSYPARKRLLSSF